MKRIFYLTRTLPVKNTGGAVIRRGSIRYLKENGFMVIVVAPSLITEKRDDRILVKGLQSKLDIKWNMLKFKMGWNNDYMTSWVNKAYRILKSELTKDDIVVATSGGELGTLMLASKLKKSVGCRVVYNLHDPIDFTIIEGDFTYQNNYNIKSRDNVECAVFSEADMIVTSSGYYAEALKKKYPQYAAKIGCHHFGYIEKYAHPQTEMLQNKRLNIVYGGNMGRLQGPEILIDVAKEIPQIQFTMIGNVTFAQEEMPPNVQILPLMTHEEYLKYLCENADIGFFSLVSGKANYGIVSKLCVPSKLYEYINIGLPIIAAVEGDAKSIINKNGYGIATSYDVESLVTAVNSLTQPNVLSAAKNRVVKDREKWFMGNTIQELIGAINDVH